MHKFILSLQNNFSLLYIALTLLCVTALFFSQKKQPFFGFEYEDAFVSSHLASQSNISEFIEYFRTNGCDLKINGECQNTFAYPGHYVSYSLYLKLISSVLSIKQAHLNHFYGNYLLLLVIIFFQFIVKMGEKDYWYILILISCLPAIYVFNAALIENLSFVVGCLLILSLKLYTRDQKWILLYFFLLILLTIIKRENLIFLMTLGFFNVKDLLNKKTFWIFLVFFITIQLVINPFYTEGIEANALGKATFSLDYLLFQFPTYFAAFFRPDGFLIITLSLFLLIKPNRRSMFFLLNWFVFVLLYSLHYRSQYAIISQSIGHFETFRYMFNTLPLLYGAFVFGDKRNWKHKKTEFVLTITIVGASFIYYNSIIRDFKQEEITNYHMVNSKLNKMALESPFQITIIDNFELISMINSKNYPVDIYSTLQFKGVVNEGEYYLINRFNLIDIELFKIEKNVLLRKIENLSSPGGDVYLVKNSIE